jgi:hypothetical protein
VCGVEIFFELRICNFLGALKDDSVDKNKSPVQSIAFKSDFSSSLKFSPEEITTSLETVFPKKEVILEGKLRIS